MIGRFKLSCHFSTWLSPLIAFLAGMLFMFLYIKKAPTLFTIQGRTVISISPPSNLSRSIRSASFDRCGTWQEAYIARHRAILNGNLPPRYLVSVAVEAGLADRLSGILTEFFFALLTDRAFQITTYGTLPRFEAAFFAPNINWSRPTDPDELIANLKFTYHGQRGYTGNRSYSPGINTSWYWPVYLVNDYEANTFFLSANVSKYPVDHDQVSTVFVASNRGRIVGLFDNPYHRAQLFRMGFRPETAVKCAFDFLFAPTNAVQTAMFREFSALHSAGVLKIAINIRVGDPVFNPEHDAGTTLAPYIPYFDCATNIESFARLPKQRVIWYLTSDSLRLRQLAKERYGDTLFTDDKLRYVHGDCGGSNAQRYGNCTQEAHDFSIRMAAGQILAMSMCDYHVVSLMSGFGRFAVVLANHWHSAYQLHTSNRSCTQTDYDSFEVLTTVGAGI